MIDDRLREEAYRQLRHVAQDFGRAPTMKEFAAHPDATIRPQQIVKMHGKGGWNAARMAAGLQLQTGLTNDDLARALAALATRLGSIPGSKEINAADDLPSASLYIHRFGSLQAALGAAGLAKPQPERMSDEALVEAGLRVAASLGHLPGWSDWVEARKTETQLPSEWQVYRRFGGGKDSWRLFHYLIFEAATASGVDLPGEHDPDNGRTTE